MCRSACPAALARSSIYAAKRLCCGPGEERRDPTKQFYIKLFFSNTVILTNGPEILPTTTFWLRCRFCPTTESAHSYAERPTDQRNSPPTLAPEVVAATDCPPLEPQPANGGQISHSSGATTSPAP